MSIQKENRRESYDVVLETLGKRHQQCVDDLRELGGEASANDLARHLHEVGTIPHYNTNFTNPRLIELAEQGKIEVIGKKKDPVTLRNVAIYKLIEDEPNETI